MEHSINCKDKLKTCSVLFYLLILLFPFFCQPEVSYRDSDSEQSLPGEHMQTCSLRKVDSAAGVFRGP